MLDLLLLAAGLVLLVKGADIMVSGASGIAARFGIPPLVIGLTVVAIGTSLPEVAVSVSASLKGSADIAVGNVFGSNIFNILVILGLTALISPLRVARSTSRYEMPFVVATTLLLPALGADGVLSRADSAVMWALLAAFGAYLFIMTRSGAIAADSPPPQTARPMIMLALMTVAGLVMIAYGSDLAVDAATSLARAAGVSERFIGLTVIAFGTSLPELATSVSAARRGMADLAIGNVIGSNILNVLLIIGVSTLISPVAYSSAFAVDAAVAASAAALLWAMTFKKLTLSRLCGALLLACYSAYFIYLL